MSTFGQREWRRTAPPSAESAASRWRAPLLRRHVVATRRSNQTRRYAAATAFFVGVTVVWLLPLVLGLETRVLGGASDATNGLRHYWAAERQGENPFTFRHDSLIGAPEGVANSSAIAVANAVQPAFIWLVKGALGFFGAWNLLLVIGFVLTGTVTFVLLDRMGLHWLPSIFGSYVFAFSPHQFEKAYAGHAALVQTWVIPLLLLMLLRLRRRRTLPAAAIAGLVLGATFYVNSYYGLFGLFVVAVFLLVELFFVRGWSQRLWVFTMANTMAAGCLAVLVPALAAYVKDADRSSLVFQRSIDDLQLFGAAPLAYIVPSERHPVFGDLVAGLWAQNDTRHFAEPTLFYGYVTFVLALVAFVLWARGNPFFHAHGRSFLVAFASLLVPVALVTSLPRLVDVLGVSIPMPAYLIGEVTTSWRVFARFGVLVGFGLVLLAAMALQILVRRRHGLWLGLAIAGVAAFELAPGPPTRTWAVNEPPAHVAWLARHPGGIVAHYPMLTDQAAEDRMEGYEYYFQVQHKHPLFWHYGFVRPDSREEAIRMIAKFPTAEATPGVLAAERVRYVVLHDDIYCEAGEFPPVLSDGLRLVAQFPGTRIFTVQSGPLSIDEELRRYAFDGALARGALPVEVGRNPFGFYDAERYKGETGRWLHRTAELVVDNPNPAGFTFQLSMTAFSAFRPRTLLVVGAQGRVLARERVETFAKDFTLGPFALPEGRSKLILHTFPGPQRLAPRDHRIASVFITRLALRPVLDYRKWGIRPSRSPSLEAVAPAGRSAAPADAQLVNNDGFTPGGVCDRLNARARTSS